MRLMRAAAYLICWGCLVFVAMIVVGVIGAVATGLDEPASPTMKAVIWTLFFAGAVPTLVGIVLAVIIDIRR